MPCFLADETLKEGQRWLATIAPNVSPVWVPTTRAPLLLPVSAFGYMSKCFCSSFFAAGENGGDRERREGCPGPPGHRALRRAHSRRRRRRRRRFQAESPSGGISSRHRHRHRLRLRLRRGSGRRGGRRERATGAVGGPREKSGGRKDVPGPLSAPRVRRGRAPHGLHGAEGFRGGGLPSRAGERERVRAKVAAAKRDPWL